MTKDNVPATVDAVVYYRVVTPAEAVVKVKDFHKATYLVAQTTLRSVLGQSELDELLAERDKINHRLQEIIDEQTEPWGIKVSMVEQTLSEVAAEHNSTTIFPLPIDLFTPYIKATAQQGARPIGPSEVVTSP
jgi:regulator of protease activity HflC (stomatin/prohibitin superfamily)